MNNRHSSPSMVSSGLPQGSVLGPNLLLLHVYIHYVVGYSSSNTRLFADDTMLYQKKKNEEHHVLQGDVNLPSKWAESSQKEFNVRKFNRLCISNMRFFISLLQYMNGQLVDEVTSHDLKIILIVSPAKQTKPWVLQGAL